MMGRFSLPPSLAEIAVFLIIPATFAVQLILCFKAKRAAVKLIPTAICLAATVGFFAYVFAADGWEAFGALILSLWSAIALAVCGLGWGIWLLCKFIKKKGDSEEDSERL